MMLRTVPSIFLAATLLLSSGCVKKGFTKPHSEIVAEAASQGIEMPSLEQERAEFFAPDEMHRQRLLTLLRKRSSLAFRDVNYRIGPGDEIEVNVFDVPELNVSARVKQSGFVTLPLIGAIQAGGLTESEFHDELLKRLATYVRFPQASVFVSDYGSQKVAVLGAVAKPGTYPLKKGSNSILELISEAGGMTDKAGNLINFIPAELSGIAADNDVEARAKLALASDSAPHDVGTNTGFAGNQVLQLYADQVLGTSGGVPLEIPVRGGDMLIIPEAGKVMVEGEVEKSGSYELGQQMTLLGALAAAGGITYGAKVDEVEVVRDVGARKARLVMSLEKVANGEEHDVHLRNGDIVRVPSDSGRRLTQDTFEGISRIINFGIGGTINVAH